MKQRLMTIFSRTPVHVGAGNSVGAIDSPVQRERHTRIPIIPGSSLKGVLADLWAGDMKEDEKNNWIREKGSEAEWLFGSGSDTEALAGALLIGEARVLAFPVRSAKGSFAWITSPLALARFRRDSGSDINIDKFSLDDENRCYGGEDVLLGDSVVLEEYKFTSIDLSSEIADKLSPLVDDDTWRTVSSRLVIVSDEIFSYFAENACEVVTRIRVNDRTGTVEKGALFNQEQVPSETLFYSVIGAQDKKGKNGQGRKAEEALDKLAQRLGEEDIGNLIQVGGDETIGLGYCSVKLLEVTR